MKPGPNRKTRKIGAGGAGPGRPKGARGKVSEAARSILGEKGGLVVQKVIDAAIEGDMAEGRALHADADLILRDYSYDPTSKTVLRKSVPMERSGEPFLK